MISNETRRHYRAVLSGIHPHTQNYKVLKHILENGSIRQDIAWEEYSISRLGAVIFNLNNMGVDFETEWQIDEKTKRPMKFITYSLADSFPSEEEAAERKRAVKNANNSFERRILLKEISDINKKLTLNSLRTLKEKAEWLLSKEQEKEEQLTLF